MVKSAELSTLAGSNLCKAKSKKINGKITFSVSTALEGLEESVRTNR
jgi:hypothetical protein